MSRQAHELFLAMKRAATEAPGALPSPLRQRALSSEPLDEPLQSFCARVRSQAADIGDEDLAPLRAAGLSEDAIFELAVAVAVGASDRRLSAARRALSGESK